jgi:hypothetical protein
MSEDNTIILSAKTNLNARNTENLYLLIKEMQNIIHEQDNRIKSLENNLIMVSQDITNTKSMVGFLHGRGTGPSGPRE